MYWNPHQTFTWTKNEIDQWASLNGWSSFYNGELWEIRYRKITPGRYKVWFVKADGGGR